MDRLPPPLFADLNGNGRREVLLPTHDAKIQILQLPAHAGLASAAALDGFHEARVMAEISLLPANVRVAAIRRPVAMAVGAVDRTIDTIVNTHGVKIFFWFFKLIVVAQVTYTRYR